jgi:DNA invertase Pin-like site-specific DNA recombinase
MNRAANPVARAVAYYRHSAQDRQENSIPIQQEQVRRFAREHRIEIIKEFADAGKSGLSTEGRDGFNEMIHKYVEGGAAEFEYVLVLDVSRWGRFQDIDQSSYFSGLCRKHGKKVVYTSIGFQKDDDLVHFLRLDIDRYRAATYSKELSDKVWRGCVKISEQGFRAGGPPPYGLHRLLLDEQHRPLQTLEPGQRKSIQNQRVTLTKGDEREVEVVRRIFRLFAEESAAPERISQTLNAEGIPAPGGTRWNVSSVRHILVNPLYVGTMVYNKTSQKLQSARRHNPRDAWVLTPKAFEAIVDPPLFEATQRRIAAEESAYQSKYGPAGMLDRLRLLYDRCGMLRGSLVESDPEMASVASYRHRFAGLDMAYQRLFDEVRKKAAQETMEQLRRRVTLEQYADYVVLSRSLSVLIQPVVPAQFGYDDYWAFRPDPRKEIDITLGVPLVTHNGAYEVAGYMVFPRLLTRARSLRVSVRSDGCLSLYGWQNLDMIWSILEGGSPNGDG